MKKTVILLCLSAAFAFGQQTVPEDPAGVGRFSPVSLADQFFDNNYFNYYLFANGVYDTYAPLLNSTGQSSNNGAFGYSIGGGVTGTHKFRRSVLSLSYLGSYQDYKSSLFSSGTNQNLNLTYSQRLSRRWTLSIAVGAGILFYGNGYFGSQPTSATNVQANPFGSQTRFVSSSVSARYNFTRRMSLSLTGFFGLQRYSFPGSIGNTGGGGDVGLQYRITARTTVSGDYSRSYYKYQGSAGDANIDNVSLSIYHMLPRHWIVSASGGISHTNTTGVIAIPLSLITGQQGVGGYVLGRYNATAYLPSFSGTVTHNMRHSSFNFSGGQSVASGNGYYLASRNQFINGGYSRALYRSFISAGMNYYRLKSVANAVQTTYNGFSAGAGYGYTVTKHISANFRYDYLRYGNLAPLPSVADNRLSFGVSFSSKSIPLTFY